MACCFSIKYRSVLYLEIKKKKLTKKSNKPHLSSTDNHIIVNKKKNIFNEKKSE